MKARCEVCGFGASFLVKVNGRPERLCGADIAKARSSGKRVEHMERLRAA